MTNPRNILSHLARARGPVCFWLTRAPRERALIGASRDIIGRANEVDEHLLSNWTEPWYRSCHNIMVFKLSTTFI